MGPSKWRIARVVRVGGRKGEKEWKCSMLKHIKVRFVASGGMEEGELTVARLGENFVGFMSNGIL